MPNGANIVQKNETGHKKTRPLLLGSCFFDVFSLTDDAIRAHSRSAVGWRDG